MTQNRSLAGIPANSSAVERMATLVVWLGAALVTAVFLWIIGDILRHGMSGISWAFLSSAPQRSGRAGGILPVLVSTFWILIVALAVAVPVGTLTAVWLADFARRGGRLAMVVKACLDVLAGVPSIVFGLFGNAVFCRYLGLGYSLLAGGLTLACMVLPILIRALEAEFRAVPDDYRFAATALGMSRTRTVTAILLPAALPGLAVGLILGVGRVLAETAALLFTSGYVDRMPRSLMDSGRSLSIHIYDLSMNVPGGEANAYATAVVLVGLLTLINGAVLWLSDHVTRRFHGAI